METDLAEYKFKHLTYFMLKPEAIFYIKIKT